MEGIPDMDKLSYEISKVVDGRTEDLVNRIHFYEERIEDLKKEVKLLKEKRTTQA